MGNSAANATSRSTRKKITREHFGCYKCDHFSLMIAIDLFYSMHMHPIRVYMPPFSGDVHGYKRFQLQCLIVAGLWKILFFAHENALGIFGSKLQLLILIKLNWENNSLSYPFGHSTPSAQFRDWKNVTL